MPRAHVTADQPRGHELLQRERQRARVDAAESGGTEMVIRTHFDSLAGMEHVLATGVEEGMVMVIDQIDAALAGAAT